MTHKKMEVNENRMRTKLKENKNNKNKIYL